MRYAASEKLEIIRLVERSQRPAKWTLDKLGVPRLTFYRWYDRYLEHGEDGLVDHAPMPRLVWNKIPDTVRAELLDMSLDIPELSPRELAVRFTDTKGYFVSESSVYRLLKAPLSDTTYRLPGSARLDIEPSLYRDESGE